MDKSNSSPKKSPQNSPKNSPKNSPQNSPQNSPKNTYIMHDHTLNVAYNTITGKLDTMGSFLDTSW